MPNMNGKIALVTGASRGIGKGIALELAKNGAKVVINYHSNESLAKDLEAQIGAKQALALGFDIAQEDSVSEAAKSIETHFGAGVDILINNAGITIDGLLMRFKAEDFDKIVNTNLKGTFVCSKVFVKGMIRKKYGRIVNVASVSGQMGNIGQSVYSATKAGVIGFTKSLAREVARKNIIANVVSPGFIATDMTTEVLERGQEEIIKQIPLGRIGEVQDIAKATAFLASDDAAYITGQVLSVNGGLYI